MEFSNCPICESSNAKIQVKEDADYVECNRCGKFQITGSTKSIWKASLSSKRKMTNISSWIRENSNILIDSDRLNGLASLEAPSVTDRAYKLLIEVSKRQKSISDYISVKYHQGDSCEPWLAVSWSLDEGELRYLFLHVLRDAYGYIETYGNAIGLEQVRLSPNGYKYLESRDSNVESSTGFCAMWFHESMQVIYLDAIVKGIRDAGYQPSRVDEVEHAGRIDDEIFASIKKARFVVADFTGHRGGVYFEAGYAQGLGLPVIWTCRKDEIEKLHFDISQYNCIDWTEDDLPKFSKRLMTRIEAVLGRGPH